MPSEPAQGLMVHFRLTSLLPTNQVTPQNAQIHYYQAIYKVFGWFVCFCFPFLLPLFSYINSGYPLDGIILQLVLPSIQAKGRLIINYLTIYFWRFHQDVVYLSTALGINRNVWPGEVPCPAPGSLSFVLVCLWLLRAEMYSCPHLFLFWLLFWVQSVNWLHISGFMSDHEVISWWQRTDNLKPRVFVNLFWVVCVCLGILVFSGIWKHMNRKLMFFFLAFNVIHWVWCFVFVCCGFLKLKIRVSFLLSKRSFLVLTYYVSK